LGKRIEDRTVNRATGLHRSLHNMKLFGAALFVTSLTLLSSNANAQDSQPLALIWFQQIDKDGDDAISGPELDDMRTRRFIQIDLDRDRALTPAEFMQDLSTDETKTIERREKRFALMDRDGSGTVDVVEYINFGSTVMELLDADSDGYIRRAEFTEAVATPE
jgi:Ca2+-binding EF-hand superfamily protein